MANKPSPSKSGARFFTRQAAPSDATSGGLEETEPGDDSSPTTDRPREVGGSLKIDRFIYLAHIGAGAMGEVCAAYDPKLDRKIAIKLVHSSNRDNPNLRRRMEREAQAMAQLSHPNVVTVYEVGDFDGRLFVAMEFINGQDLSTWLKVSEESRPWQQVLSKFLQAGRGLAAAHRVGIIHRDFKPQNVFLDEDGRVTVGDFGLARWDTSVETTDEPFPVADSKDETRATKPSDARIFVVRATHGELTQTGGLMGTPAYMAPEQWKRETTTHHCDQYSYCVALWEAVFGQRPYVGATGLGLMVNVLDGRRAEPPTGSGVPSWLRMVLEKGLSLDPVERYESMDALLVALENDPTRKRQIRRRIVAGIAIVAVGTLGGVLTQDYIHSQKVAGCQAAGGEIYRFWNEEGKGAVKDAFLETGKPHAASVFEKTAPWLDEWAGEWAHTTTEACINNRVTGVWDDALYVQANDCLLEKRDMFETLLTQFSQAEAGLVGRATPAAASLPPSASCLKLSELQRRPKVDPNTTIIRRKLAGIGTYAWTGNYNEGLRVATELATKCEMIECGATKARARFWVGSFQSDLGDQKLAEGELLRAFSESAVPGGDDNIRLTTASLLIPIVGVHLNRPKEGFVWSRVNESLIQRIGAWETEHAVSLWANTALLHQSLSEFEPARDLLKKAIKLSTKLFGREHPKTLDLKTNLATLLNESGDSKASSKRLLIEIVDTRIRIVGEEHPAVATDMYNLAIVLSELGENNEALSTAQRVLSMRLKIFGPEHLGVALTYDMLANIAGELGDHTSALDYNEQSLRVFETTLGKEHPEVAVTLGNRAIILKDLGRDDEAFSLLERGLTISEKALGPDHVHTAFYLTNIGTLHSDSGRAREARPYLERAIEIRRKHLGTEHPSFATTRFNLAKVDQELGSLKAAQVGYREACLVFTEKLGKDHPKTTAASEALAGLRKKVVLSKSPSEEPVGPCD